jgi:hypothetical protein
MKTGELTRLSEKLNAELDTIRQDYAASMMAASWFWMVLLTRSELTELGLTRIDQGEQTWLTLDPDQTELKTCTMAGTPVICIKIEER